MPPVGGELAIAHRRLRTLELVLPPVRFKAGCQQAPATVSHASAAGQPAMAQVDNRRHGGRDVVDERVEPWSRPSSRRRWVCAAAARLETGEHRGELVLARLDAGRVERAAGRGLACKVSRHCAFLPAAFSFFDWQVFRCADVQVGEDVVDDGVDRGLDRRGITVE